MQRRRRPAGEGGFTLIELLVVIVIIGILLAIAVPSYLGMKDKASDAAAKANIRAAVPSAEAYYSDHNNYGAMTIALMKGYDSGLKDTGSAAVTLKGEPLAAGATSYCLQATGGTGAFHFSGPGGEVASGACP